MKVVTPKQMAFLESQAFRNGSKEEEFMDQAGKGVAEWVHYLSERENLSERVFLLCGKGNNAGDAYVAGCYLLGEGYQVTAYQIVPMKECSPLCKLNHKKFLELGGLCHEINQIKEELKFDEEGIILDGLFGTGFHGVAKEPYSSAIKAANRSGLPIIAIDIPSGLNGESGIVEGVAIRAKETIFLGLPKTGFFLQDGWNHVGKLRYVDIGLSKSYIEECDCDFHMLYTTMIRPYLPKIINDRHKYQAGYVVGLAGSPGMPGAAILSSLSALRSGAGIVKLLHPSGMESELASCPPEIIKVPYSPYEIEKILEYLNAASGVYIGPGLGRDEQARALLKGILPNLKKPCVIDADALTIIAEEKIKYPTESILTPHIGEMMRLLKSSAPKPHTKEFLHTCKLYAEKHGVTLVLKGGPSFIFHPNDSIWVNPYGDPGMATAGSGDVLTGMIASLIAQNTPCKQAAPLGVYLHGFAGEQAASLNTSYCMIASDIIELLPAAFASLI